MNAEERRIDVPGYEVTSILGQGGMAAVYLAKQLSLGRQVAIKVLFPEAFVDSNSGDRFLKETRILASFNHPNIVSIYDAGKTDDNYYYLSMECLNGGGLAEKIKQGLSPKQCLAIIRDIASALSAAHKEGFIHRDIKPDNIMFRNEGDDTAVLTDFGIAREVERDTGQQQLTAVHTVIGSLRYMSPEQSSAGELDPRSDIFSLGVVLYHCLTRKAPYESNTIQVLWESQRSVGIPQMEPVHKAFQPLMDKMLALEPAQRFQTAEELVVAIDKVVILRGTPAPQNNDGATEVLNPVDESPDIATTLIDNTGRSKGGAKKTSPATLMAIGAGTVSAAALAAWFLLLSPPPPAPVEIESADSQTQAEQAIAATADTGKTTTQLAPSSETAAEQKDDSTEQTIKTTIGVDEFYAYQAVLQEAMTTSAFRERFADSAFLAIVQLIDDSGESLQQLTDKANNNDPVAQFQLAEIYDTGITVQAEKQLALQWAQRSAANQYSLGKLQWAVLLLGKNAMQTNDRDQAIALLKQLSVAGNFIAMNILAEIYINGKLAKQDIPRGINLFKQSAELGDYSANETLARIYSDGRLVAKNPTLANNYLRNAKPGLL